jgi:hypothetical protein
MMSYGGRPMSECFCFFCERPDRPIDTSRDWHVLAAAGGWRPPREADVVFHERCFAEFLSHCGWYGGYKTMGGRYGELASEDCYECCGSATARIDRSRLRHARAMLMDNAGERGAATLFHLDCLERVMALTDAVRGYVVASHEVIEALDGR